MTDQPWRIIVRRITWLAWDWTVFEPGASLPRIGAQGGTVTRRAAHCHAEQYIQGRVNPKESKRVDEYDYTPRTTRPL